MNLRMRSRLPAALFLLPAGLLSLLLIALPLLGLVSVSLFDWKLTQSDQWRFVGLGNYQQLMTDSHFWRSMGTTGAFLVESVALQLVAGVGIALLFNHRLRGLGLVRTLFLAPMMIAPVFAGMIWRLFLSDDFGIVKYALQLAGWLEPPLWLADPAFALHAVVVISAWQWIPFVVLFVLAGLQVIPSELFEAARIDGAGPLSRFWYVTLPLLTPIVMTVAIFRVIDAIKVFDLIYATTAGGPGDSTETISYLVYQTSMNFFDIGYGSAVATLMLLAVCALALVMVKLNSRPGRPHDRK
ncbi:MAG: sugar ABC transporter permease [Burkholderiaceae bacterium]